MSPTSLRVVGRIFAFHDAQGIGHARLTDNRRVWVSVGQLEKGSPTPTLGDTIEFDLTQSDRGLEATRVIVLRNGNSGVRRADQNAAEPVGQLPLLTDPEDQVSETLLTEDTQSAQQGTAGANDAQALYQQAAIARAEARFQDARNLFERAIKAGSPVAVYVAYAKMEMDRGTSNQAKNVVERAIKRFPSEATLYVMYGQMERRRGNLGDAEKILREGLRLNPDHLMLRQGLARVLADSGTQESLKEADGIFRELERAGKLNRRDGSYQRFRALHQSPRAGQAYVLFDSLPGFLVAVAGRRDLPRHITDLVVQVSNSEFEASYGLTGDFLVRCFDRQPQKAEIIALSKLLRSATAQSTIGLIDGREVVINTGLAFVVVPGAAGVRDYLMSVLSENNEALIPIDDSFFGPERASPEKLRSVLAQFLGARDLYNSTLPVSGRRFFGRERLLVELTDQVHRGDFIGIYGLRKMGKTSLIWQLRDEKLRDDAVAYVDLQASPALMLGSFQPVYWELEMSLHHKLVAKYPDAAKLMRLARTARYSDLAANNVNCALVFAEDLRELLNHIASGNAGDLRKVVIVLDELERILPLTGQHVVEGYLEFFGLLRGLAQSAPYRGLISSVVVAANASISERAYWEGRENPVFALYKRVFLPPLSDRDTFEMVKGLGKGMSVYWNEDALGEIFADTGGHPFLTRLLCSRIISGYPKRPLTITRTMVQSTVPLLVREETDKFSQIIELLHTYFPDEEQFLERIATGEPLPRMTDEALGHLLGYQLVAREGDGYRITINLLNHWLRRRAGLQE